MSSEPRKASAIHTEIEAEHQRSQHAEAPDDLGADVDHREAAHGARRVEQRGEVAVHHDQELRRAEHEDDNLDLRGAVRGAHHRGHRDEERGGERDAHEDDASEEIRGVLRAHGDLLADVRVEAEPEDHEEGRGERVGEVQRSERGGAEEPGQRDAHQERHAPGRDEGAAEGERVADRDDRLALGLRRSLRRSRSLGCRDGRHHEGGSGHGEASSRLAR